MTDTLTCAPVQQYFDNASVELAGGKLFTYSAGTTNKATTFTDSGGGTQNNNPIILNSRGEANVWIPANTGFKFVLAPASDSDPPANPFWTVDNIINSTAGVSTISFGSTGLTPNSATSGAVTVAGTLAVANGGTGASTATITSFNNITGFTAVGTTGTTSTNLVFSTSPTLMTPTLTTPAINGGSVTPAATPTTTAPGYLGSPINTQNGTYTTVMSDTGQTIYHTSASTHTWTIDSNANVAYPIGTIICFNNENGGGNVTIAITSDTLRWGSSTGSRTLAANGQAQAQKMASTLWRLTGAGIS